MTPIINSSFNKHPISWELIRRRLLHPSDIVMKLMYRHQTLDGLPKQRPNKLNKASCTICCILKMTTLPKGKKLAPVTSSRRTYSYGFFLLQCNFRPWIHLHDHFSLIKY